VDSILIVEDYAPCTLAFSALLERFGHPLAHATSAEGALRAAQSMRLALVIMDVGLPDGVDGVETAQRIRRLPGCEHTPVIFVSGRGDDTFRREVESPDNFVLQKPVDNEEFVRLVGQILAS
jgi:CheY-like chemotaxis protein